MKAYYKKLICTIISCVLLLSVLVCAIVIFAYDSKAWMASNRNVNSKGLVINTEQEIKFISAQLIKCDDDENVHLLNIENPYKPTLNYGIDTTDLPESIKPENYLKLNKYDTVFVEEKSIYTPIILKLTLGNVNSAFNLTINYKSLLNENSIFETIIENENAENESKKHEMRSTISNVLEVRCTANNDTLGTLFDSNTATLSEEDYNSAKEEFGVSSAGEEDTNVNKHNDTIISSENHVDRTFISYEETGEVGERVTYLTDGSGDIASSTEKQNVVFKFSDDLANVDREVDVYIYLGYNVVLLNEYIYHKTGSAEIKSDSLYGSEVEFNEDIINFSFSKVDR